MKSLLSISISVLLAFGLLTGCGGGGNVGTMPRQVLVGFGASAADLSLSGYSLGYQLVLYANLAGTRGNVVYGPADLVSYNADENVYSARIDNILDGTYFIEIRQVAAFEGDSLVVASVQAELNVAGNETRYDLTNPVWDFDSYDKDSDGFNNFDELSAGTGPTEEDSDGDGVLDGVDAFPLDESEAYDFDADGYGDSRDNDIDNDGLSNSSEIDAGTNALDRDSDDDGDLDGADNCPVVANEDQLDTDLDGSGDNCDGDTDGDGVSDVAELANGSNPRLADTDGDGTSDSLDAFATLATESVDTDQDGTGNNSDTDDDNDGVLDSAEAASGSSPLLSDTDNDGINDRIDNCPVLANPGQGNNDSDASGDDCDTDDDNDGLSDAEEGVIGADGFITNAWLADSDGDGFSDQLDNCPLEDNIDQDDSDGDSFGDSCDCGVSDASVNQLAVDHPDPAVLDLNCDGIDGDRYEAIFVATNGSAQADNTDISHPTSDLYGAIQIAAQTGQDVYVAAGDYNISNVSFLDGVDVYGGFSETYLDRDILGVTYGSRLVHQTGNADNASVSLSNFTQETVLAGLILENDGETDNQTVLKVSNANVVLQNLILRGNAHIDTETLVSVENSQVVLEGGQFVGLAPYSSTGASLTSSTGRVINSLLTMGGADHTVGLNLVSSTVIVSNNTIDGGQHGVGTSYGVVINHSAPKLYNNFIVTKNNLNQASVYCEGLAQTEDLILSGNAFLRLTDRSLTYPVFVSCAGDVLDSDAEVNASSDVYRGSLNLVLDRTTSLASLVDVSNFYTPVLGSPLSGTGIETSSASYGSVQYDLLGAERSSSFSIGAVEE